VLLFVSEMVSIPPTYHWLEDESLVPGIDLLFNVFLYRLIADLEIDTNLFTRENTLKTSPTSCHPCLYFVLGVMFGIEDEHPNALHAGKQVELVVIIL
jgi:hypothetical protein